MLIRFKRSVLIDSGKFALFLMLFNVVYKGVLCLMRNLGWHDDRVNAPVAGFLSALCIAFDQKSRRNLFIILTMSKAIDATITKLETETGKIPYKPLIFWTVANWFLMNVFAHEPDLMIPGQARAFTKLCDFTYNEKLLRDTWARMWMNSASTGY